MESKEVEDTPTLDEKRIDQDRKDDTNNKDDARKGNQGEDDGDGEEEGRGGEEEEEEAAEDVPRMDYTRNNKKLKRRAPTFIVPSDLTAWYPIPSHIISPPFHRQRYLFLPTSGFPFFSSHCYLHFYPCTGNSSVILPFMIFG